MRKDTVTTIRINKEVKAVIKSMGLSEQKILDMWIKDNLEIESTVIKEVCTKVRLKK